MNDQGNEYATIVGGGEDDGVEIFKMILLITCIDYDDPIMQKYYFSIISIGSDQSIEYLF